MSPSTLLRVAIRTVEARIRKELGLSPRPYKVLLELTSECNSRCSRCAIWKTSGAEKARELRLSELEGFFRGSGKDIVWLALSGGEVTLYDDFPEVVRLARRFCPHLGLVTFTTNGLLPERALACARAVRRTGADCFVTVSLDGDEATHDALRGVKGNHALAETTLAELEREGIAVHYGITLGPENEAFVARSYRALRDRMKAVTFVHGGGIYGQPNALDDASIARSLGVIDRDYEIDGPGALVEKIFLKVGRTFVEKRRSENVIPCAVGHTAVHIRPGGDAHHCMFLPPLGNVRHGATLRELVASPSSKRLLDDIARGECPHCWMNCYAPHSILMSPLRSVLQLFRRGEGSPVPASAQAPASPHPAAPNVGGGAG